jgi:predicted RNase H-like HicB family nuclease
MTIEYREDQGGYYVASYIELSDLTTTGSTPEKAVKNV